MQIYTHTYMNVFKYIHICACSYLHYTILYIYIYIFFFFFSFDSENVTSGGNPEFFFCLNQLIFLPQTDLDKIS